MRNVALAAGAVLALAAIGYVAARRAGQAIAANSHLINPTDSRNLVYQGVNEVGSSITGEANFSLGGWLYDITHPGVASQIEALQAGADPASGPTTIGYTEPAADYYPHPLDSSP